jgi:multidrug efflux pump subunit AcrA (membrane-fusion protein)
MSQKGFEEMKRAVVALLITVIAAVVLAGSAFASSLTGGHVATPPGTNTVSPSPGTSTSSPGSGTLNATGTLKPPTVTSQGTLPFTGLDLGLVAAGALGVLGLGAGMRRSARARR